MWGLREMEEVRSCLCIYCIILMSIFCRSRIVLDIKDLCDFSSWVCGDVSNLDSEFGEGIGVLGIFVELGVYEIFRCRV